jgi:hypothetical protein
MFLGVIMLTNESIFNTNFDPSKEAGFQLVSTEEI